MCDRAFDGRVCGEHGEHFCDPRADHVQAFVEEIASHTKDVWASRPFVLAGWQREDIIRPLFGTVVWSAEHQRYVRRYRIAWIEIARKNGKALDVRTPVLTASGWKPMGRLRSGDRVHAPDGTLTRVLWVGERHVRPSYRVDFADGAHLVATDEHRWTVNDRRFAKTGPVRVVTTAQLHETLTYGSRGDRRYTVDVPAPLQRPEVELPLDPYVLGAWLGDGSASKAEITSADPQIVEAVERAGYVPTYRYRKSAAETVGFTGGLLADLRRVGVLGGKHIPTTYLLASARQRLALLRGLMDTDGSVSNGSSGSPRVEFCSTSPDLAYGVLHLARSLGWKATINHSRARLEGIDCGIRWRVCWTAYRGRSPFTLARKTERLRPDPGRRSRSRTNAIVAAVPVEPVEAVCIAVDHPSGCFLAGRSLTPTHNSELLAAIALYLLVGDGVQGSEVYGVAGDRDQARKVWDVADRMVALSPVLARRLRTFRQAKRIVDDKTGSYYEIVAADAKGNLGHNPHGVVFDEVLTQPNGDLWDAMRTAMGTRVEPLMVAATTAGNDDASFAKTEHDECVRIQEDPDRAPHRFVYLRNTPRDADPFDETNWPYANPALGDFLSLQALRDEALEARNEPAKENTFRQYRLNQWVQQSTRWMPMHLYDNCAGTEWKSLDQERRKLQGRVAWAGFDLSAKFDLTAWCLLLPPRNGNDDGPVEVLWRFWIPETGLHDLDKHAGGKFAQWANAGWVTATDGDVIDYETVYRDIAADAGHFDIRGGDCDQWSMYPVIQEIGKRTGLRDERLAAYANTFDKMTPGMTELMALVRAGRFRHHANPVARYCFDACEVRHATGNPDLIRPDKPAREATGKRVDAVVAAALAAAAWATRGKQKPRRRRVAGF